MRGLAVVLLMITAGAAVAQNPQYLSMDGDVFVYEQNRHGVVLTSIDRSGSFLADDGESDPKLQPGEVVYLGRSCDAFSRTLGDGVWRFFDGGFIVEFRNERLAFPGQDITVASGDRCQM